MFNVRISESIKLKKRTPFIIHVTGDKLEKIKDSEVNANALGMGYFIKREDDENEDVSSDTDMELETVEREFADEEVSTVILYPFNIESY